MKTKSVMHLLPSLEMGGMERMVVDLSIQLRRRGWDVSVVCTNLEGELAEGLRDHDVKVDLVLPGGLGSWLGPADLITMIRRVCPDVVHTHNGFWFRGALGAWRAAVPRRIHTCHGLEAVEAWWAPIEKHLSSRLTSRVVCVSEPLVDYLATTCLIPRPKLQLVRNGVDITRFAFRRRGTLARSLGLAEGAIVLGTVARLAPIKNLSLIFRPLGRLVEAGHDVHMVIAGDGAERDSLGGQAAAASVADRVHFLGMVDDPSLILPEFDIYLMTSLTEGTSLSLLEAMSTRLPCIATAVGGNPEVLGQGSAGRLIPSNDEEALFKILRDLVGNPVERERLGLAARDRVVAEYSGDAMVTAYEHLYRAG